MFSLISAPGPPINAGMAKPTEAPALADLRKEIDRIDERLHLRLGATPMRFLERPVMEMV